MAIFIHSHFVNVFFRHKMHSISFVKCFIESKSCSYMHAAPCHTALGHLSEKSKEIESLASFATYVSKCVSSHSLITKNIHVKCLTDLSKTVSVVGAYKKEILFGNDHNRRQ